MKLRKEDRFMMFFVLCALGFFVMSAAYASGEKNYYTTVYNSSTTKNTSGVALAIAKSQHHFDWSTKAWQGSIGTGSFDGQDAISFGAGKRFKKLLINGSIGREAGKYGYGFGLNWRF